MTRRHELSDHQWEQIAPVLPAQKPKVGRPAHDHRRILNGIVWLLRTGAPWRDLPERYGKWQSVYDRFNRYRKDGTFDRVLKALRIRLDKDGHIDWDLWCVDGSSVRASRAAAGAPKKAKSRAESQEITRWAARAADGDPSSTSSWMLEAYPLRPSSPRARPTSRSPSSS
jgi:transposase